MQETKICNKCLTDFVGKRCKSCLILYQKLYYKENKAKVNKRNQKNYYKNKNKILAKQKIYLKTHKNQRREYNKEYENRPEIKERRKIRKKQRQVLNPFLKVKLNISRIINSILHGNKKNSSIWNFLNYTKEQLKNHIESLFEPWMNWDNYGKYNVNFWDDNNSITWTWSLDHIIPHSDLPYDSMDHPNFKKCWTLENLRPLSAKQNIIDGATRIRHKKLK